MAVEHSPANRRGLYGCIPQLGAPAGLFLATVAFSLVVQIGEQVDYLRFLPEKTRESRVRWWTAVLVAGPAPDDPCIGLRGARLDRCVQTTVPAAYADVRRAYNAARRAGVDSDYLGDVQRRWVRLQRRSSDNPYDLLDGYDDIRGELIDAVRRQRDGDY